MRSQQGHAGHHAFDVEAEIVKMGNVPSPVSLRPWQRRIDRVAGKTPDGKSRVRIVWGQDFEKASMLILDERRLKYPFWRYENGGQIKDIGIPRFYVEELHELSELKKVDWSHDEDRWERARYHVDENTGERLDVLGPCPESGFYSCLFMIAYHDGACCHGAGHVNYEPCLGSYREPNDIDIERIQRAIWNRNHASRQENAPSDEFIRKRQQDYIEKRDERRQSRFRDEIAQWMTAHSTGFDTLDPTPKSWGRWHFMGGHNRAGLTQEEINAIRNNIRANGAGSGN